MFDHFADSYYLWLLLLIPIFLLLYWKRRDRKGATLEFSSLAILKQLQTPFWLRHLPFLLRCLVLALLVVVLARPQSSATREEILSEGIDIVLALDLSSSMLSEDIQPNRIEAAKTVVRDFIQGRHNDRIGMVVFAAQGFTQCPLTLDYSVLVGLLDDLKVGIIDDGTAIGMGLATAVKRLSSSAAESKVIVLVTDGRNNTGEIDPITATDLAVTNEVRVYTIGVGSHGSAPYPVNDPLLGRRYVQVEVDVDEDTLKRIADTTGGKYFRATDRESLESIYAEIDTLEKTEIEVKQYTRYGELFARPLGLTSLILLIEAGLSFTVLRKIP